MRKALLLYNPLSGRRSERRVSEVGLALETLKAGGVEAAAAPTAGAGEATTQVRQAQQDGCDTVFACGGDGTIHDVVQGLVGSQTALGIIPLGTANSLACDLKMPFSPPNAAKAALTAKPKRIAVGQIEYQGPGGGVGRCYFVVTAGIGMDAHLFYTLTARAKQRLGAAAYYIKAVQLWLSHRMQHFKIEVEGQPCDPVTQLLAVRIQDFGGALRELAPGASLERDDLRLVLFHTRSRIAYLRYVMHGLAGAQWRVPGIELMHARRIACEALAEQERIFVEADGELLGTLPAKISVVPDALTILAP